MHDDQPDFFEDHAVSGMSVSAPPVRSDVAGTDAVYSDTGETRTDLDAAIDANAGRPASPEELQAHTTRGPRHRLDDDATPPAVLLEGLNERQREAVSVLNGPLLVVAGPGSGKTRVLTHRVAALLALGVEPWRVLAVTFTNKAAQEMRTRAANLVGEDQASEVWISTFHSMCVRILRRDGHHVGLPKSFSIADSDDTRRILRRILVSEGVEPREATKTADGLASSISLAKNRLMTVEQMATSVDISMRAAAPYADRYQQELAAQRMADFDDLLVKTLDLLQHHPSVAERYRSRFSHILVDEYQDTNACQYQIVRALLNEDRNLCVVGDTDQSVYSWRGATPEALRTFDSDFPDARVVILDQNYRSTPAILEVARAVIAPNPAPHRAQLWTSSSEGAPVEVHSFADDRDEARHVVDAIRRSVRHGTPGAEHAVLYRTNALSRAIESELAAGKLSYVVVGGQRFYERAEVKDALAYLRVLVNGHDVASFTRAASTPRRRLGDTTLALVATRARQDDITLTEAARRLLDEGELGRGTNPMIGYLADLERVQAAANASPVDAVGAVLGIDGFVTAATTGAAREAAGEARRENLAELETAVAEFCAEPPVGVDPTAEGLDLVAAFLEHVSLVADSNNDDSDDAVQLMTAHAAKGREFDKVWVIGVEADMFPHISSQETVSQIEEERRLLFVAVSRARRNLELSWCQRRFRFGEWRDADPSPFLGDLPDGVLYHELAAPSTRTSTDSWSSRTARRGRYQASSIQTRNHAASGPAPQARPVGTNPGPRCSGDDLHPGARVEHTTFGAGVVEGVDRDMVTVRFSDKARTLLIEHAPMRPLTE